MQLYVRITLERKCTKRSPFFILFMRIRKRKEEKKKRKKREKKTTSKTRKRTDSRVEKGKRDPKRVEKESKSLLFWMIFLHFDIILREDL